VAEVSSWISSDFSLFSQFFIYFPISKSFNQLGAEANWPIFSTGHRTQREDSMLKPVIP
jgi:hypothetical protein